MNSKFKSFQYSNVLFLWKVSNALTPFSFWRPADVLPVGVTRTLLSCQPSLISAAVIIIIIIDVTIIIIVMIIIAKIGIIVTIKQFIHSDLDMNLCRDRSRLIHSAEDQLMYSRYDSPPAHASVRTQNVVCNWQHATNVFWIYFIFCTTSSDIISEIWDILYNVHTIRNVCIYDHR